MIQKRITPFRYIGSKSRLVDWLLLLMPAHEFYCEPFAGSLALLLHKQRAMCEIANDTNEDLINFFRTLRDKPDELIAMALATPSSRSEFNRCKQLLAEGKDCSDVERAFATHYSLNLSIAGAPRVRDRYWSVCYDQDRPKETRDRVELRFQAIADRLKHVQIENVDALDLIAKLEKSNGLPPEKKLIYIDPPYYAEDRRQKIYDHEQTGLEFHKKLLDQVCECESQVMVSGYTSELYEDTLSGWTRSELQTNQPVLGARTEILWMNYDLTKTDLFAS